MAEKRPAVKTYFMPSTETDAVLANGQQIADMLTASTASEFEVAVPTSYAAVIEALAAGKADVAWPAAFAYVLANQKCSVDAKLTTVPFGSPTYNAEIIAQADKVREARGLKPIKALDDLNGVKSAFTDSLSTSGYLFASSMLIDAGVILGEKVFAGVHNQSGWWCTMQPA